MNKSIIVLSAVFMTSILCSCSIDKATDNYAEQAARITSKPEQNEVSTTISAAEKSANEITVKINDESFTAQLYDNETADYFYEMLPLTINMNELHGNEKYYNFSSSLPENGSAVGEMAKITALDLGKSGIVDHSDPAFIKMIHSLKVHE